MRYEWNSKYILETGNDTLVVSLAEMKLYLKVDNTADDNLITSLIHAATSLVEKYISRELLNKTFTMYLDLFPFCKQYGNTVESNFNNYTIQVKRSKLQSITSIKYYDNDVLTTLDSALYSFSEDNDYSRIYLIDDSTLWPSTDDRKQAVEIEFVAGYGETTDDVPEDLKTAIKMLVAYIYENRGDCVTTSISSSSANVLLDLYRIREI